jgi:hypothetical protein
MFTALYHSLTKELWQQSRQYFCWQCSYILPLLTDHSHSLTKDCGNKFAYTSDSNVVVYDSMLTALGHSLTKDCGKKCVKTFAGEAQYEYFLISSVLSFKGL